MRGKSVQRRDDASVPRSRADELGAGRMNLVIVVPLRVVVTLTFTFAALQSFSRSWCM